MFDPPAAPRAPRRHPQQAIIDAEIRASRRALLAPLRRRLRDNVTALSAPDLLALADVPTLHTAIMIAAHGLADACDLYVVEPGSRTLGNPGLTPAAPAPDPEADGAPPIVRYQVRQTYPLRDDGGALLGILLLYYRTRGPHARRRRLADAAAQALNHVVGSLTPDGAGHHGAAEPELPPTRPTARPFTTARSGDGTVLTVGGALDAVTAPDLGEHVRRAVDALDPGQALVVDLQAVDFLAVAGARVLLRTADVCARAGVRCGIVLGEGHEARTVLDRLDATHQLPLVTDRTSLVPGRRA